MEKFIMTYSEFNEQSNNQKYTKTSVDTQKENADILITSIDGNYYTLFLNKEIEMPSGRGVKIHSDKSLSVTKRIFDELDSKYNIMTYF